MLTFAIVTVFALAIALACGYGLIYPAKLTHQVIKLWQEKSAIHIAVALRLILGLHLINIAPLSRFPLTIKTLGVVTILAAIAIVISGRERIAQLLSTVSTKDVSVIRLMFLAGLCFAGVILYSIA